MEIHMMHHFIPLGNMGRFETCFVYSSGIIYVKLMSFPFDKLHVLCVFPPCSLPTLQLRQGEHQRPEDTALSKSEKSLIQKYLTPSDTMLWYGNGPSSSIFASHVKEYHVIEHMRVRF